MYLAGLIDFDNSARSYLTPLTTGAKHLKTVRVNSSLTLNASGHGMLNLQPKYLASTAGASPASPIFYCNDNAYDPYATSSTSLPGPPDLTVATAAGLLDTEIPNARVQSLHCKFTLSGVSNLNKKGTIHLMETSSAYKWVTTGGASYIDPMIPLHNINEAPSHEVHRIVEIANMDSAVVMQYNYFPLTNANLNDEFLHVGTSASFGDSGDTFKNFTLIVAGADTTTVVRCEYEVTYECTVASPFVNTYPVQFGKCFVNSEAALNLLNQQHEARISVKNYRHKPIVNYVVTKQATEEKENLLFANDLSKAKIPKNNVKSSKIMVDYLNELQ